MINLTIKGFFLSFLEFTEAVKKMWKQKSASCSPPRYSLFIETK